MRAGAEHEVSSGSLLRQGEPLVPLDSAAARALVAVIAILSFLAALCAGMTEQVTTASSQWNMALAQETTIQLRPVQRRDMEADLKQVASLALSHPAVASARILPRSEAERLLEPWLGSHLSLSELPVPRLVVLKLRAGIQPDWSALRQTLNDSIPHASLDDHRLWLKRLSNMANALVALGVALVMLVTIAVALAAAFATRGAMAGNLDIVEVLNFIGADESFIAREFQMRFFQLGLKGAFIGAVSALFLFLMVQFGSFFWQSSAAGDQFEAMFGQFNLGMRGTILIFLIALCISLVTAWFSRQAVKRFLREQI
jgi:cell division transport system permease protein